MDHNAVTESQDIAEACVGLPPTRDTRPRLPWWLQLSWVGIGVVLATFLVQYIIQWVSTHASVLLTTLAIALWTLLSVRTAPVLRHLADDLLHRRVLSA